jgi:hypothetical protein
MRATGVVMIPMVNTRHGRAVVREFHSTFVVMRAIVVCYQVGLYLRRSLTRSLSEGLHCYIIEYAITRELSSIVPFRMQ